MIKMDFTPNKFYDALALNYDVMTEFNRRFKKESPYFHKLVEQFNLKSALDAGCGTGFHSFLLSQMGIRVTAVDISQEMLNQMREHAKDLGLDVKMLRSSLNGLQKALKDKYDSIFCLGNTLAHVMTKKELLGTFRTFYMLLNSGGILLLQILNYDRILKSGERIQSIKKSDNKEFIRFYDYEKNDIRFNLLAIERNKNRIIHSLNSVLLHPWIETDIVQILHQSKFKKIKLFGSLARSVFDKKVSKDLVVFAQK